MAGLHHQILIIGGGAAGLTVAASLQRHKHELGLDIAIVEPSADHYYQPAFTLVGAGTYDLAATRRNEERLIPDDVTWIREAATAFAPETNSVTLASGRTVTYNYLVVCPGLQLNWSAVKGLNEAITHGGVCSNYSANTVSYTWACMQALKPGDTALFTQPPMPIKCPGAPQKAAYLAADYLRRRGIRQFVDVRFLTQTPAIFGVPFYARELVKIAARHGISVHTQHNLVEIDGAAKVATFEIVGGEKQGERVRLSYDMIHVTPPQGAPDVIRTSPLASAAGYVDVHANSLQHQTYKNVFGLGDAASTANSKTAAAIRKQAPVVVRNLFHLIRGDSIEETYDGYAGCPLTTSYTKVLMAEFIYGGKPTPTLPLNPARESTIHWLIKKHGLPRLYWDYMLKGYEAFPAHNTAFVDPGA